MEHSVGNLTSIKIFQALKYAKVAIYSYSGYLSSASLARIYHSVMKGERKKRSYLPLL